MTRVTVSPKYQVVIPKDVRSRMMLKKGQVMTVLVKGDVIYLVPVAPMKHYRGIARGITTLNLREKGDRP